ncbi:valine--tRNA ligase [Bauldia litoralis]|uniref:Valine--tRNA ligase n=1 Tax=Bauldia litoralis TaxID=665467 RepID=A0A1G6DAC0_9HYPH|nr:valine--tRNA ligase [Bauldia litoralis]SDB42078.1 valyl-tRNA synthetase [Bauldia litoralis]
MLDKTFDAAAVETRVSAVWDEAEAFKAGAGAKPGAAPYSIVIPPPNVTGSLHIGHALNNTLQDVLVRFERMRGRDVLWQPGMDHAGIATQMVVERQLMERQEPGRREIGREKFLEKVWAWKDESGGLIINQLKRLGCSCDWSRERFTMDEGLSKAVTKVFVELYREKLIYRDKRLVNWDPTLQTAVSDLEVENIEMQGHLWHFKYPIEGEEGRSIVVATTRPETMLGDTGIAVHPEDERYKDLIGKYAILPLVGRRLRIVGDEHADPETGSGAVKITPAHDFNDFEVGKRQDLPMVNLFDTEANVVLEGNAEFLDGVAESDDLKATIATINGLDRFTARKRVVAMMEEKGLLEKVEEKPVMVPHDEKSKTTVIEPYLTDQWYADAKTLAQPAIASVREGRTTFIPKNWEKTYFEWMENIRPWCISRQLWWGHQIPAWYGPDGKVFVAYSEDEARAEAATHYGEATDLTRDEDVLDTWFSSALWPFSTLGWPDETPELERYYPTTALVTGFDIIFFWVARMMMTGLHFMGKEPFSDVYIHALVRDEKGAKMSKTKGNVIDPIVLIDEYGADALRFTLAAMAAQGRDIKLATARVEGYRNFATKLWNAARFAEHYECKRVGGFDPATAKETLNRWIATETTRAATAVTGAIEAYRFNDAAAALYRFTWNLYCDWYLEFSKPVLNGEDGPAKTETRATVAWVLDRIISLLHPFMPFLTEELWAREGDEGRTALMLNAWPDLGFEDSDAADEINWLIETISAVRSVRSEMNVPAGAMIELAVSGAAFTTAARLQSHNVLIRRLARAESLTLAHAPRAGALQIVVGEATFSMPLEGVIDIDAERARLLREIDKIAKDVGKIEAKLANEKFMAKAPEEVIEEQRERLAEAAALKAKTEAALARLEPAA